MQRDAQTYRGGPDAPKCKTYLPLKQNRKNRKNLFKTKFLHLKLYLENLQTTLGMNPHQIYPWEALGRT